MKKLLLLGGSRYLLPVIEVAHKLGLYVITCDYLPDNIAHKYSDEYINVSIIDKEKVLETAKANNLKPFDYFEYLLTEIPKHAEDKNTDFLTEFLPWSKSLLEHIRKSKKAVEK